jgi:hypothetical protein
MAEAKEQIAIYVQDKDVVNSPKPVKKLAIFTIGRDQEVYEIY